MKKHSGQLGFVLFPDSETQNMALDMAGDVQKNRIMFSDVSVPHLTLFHSNLRDVSDMQVKNFLFWLKEQLPLLVRFESVELFGGKFVFWMAKKRYDLVGLHNAALFALAGFFNPEGVQQADRENIELSDQEKRNVRACGHHSVGTLWKPHITLGYTEELPNSFPAPANGMLVDAAFGEVGELGVIKRVIHKA